MKIFSVVILFLSAHMASANIDAKYGVIINDEAAMAVELQEDAQFSQVLNEEQIESILVIDNNNQSLSTDFSLASQRRGRGHGHSRGRYGRYNPPRTGYRRSGHYRGVVPRYPYGRITSYFPMTYQRPGVWTSLMCTNSSAYCSQYAAATGFTIFYANYHNYCQINYSMYPMMCWGGY